MSVPVLLTACIAPGDVHALARRDSSVRLRDYLQALTWWLTSSGARVIVFCDNSGADLAPIHACVAKHAPPDTRVEVLGYRGDPPGPRGKGLGELQLIEYALTHSRGLQQEGRLLKVTGRLAVRNAPRLLTALEADTADVRCDLRDNLAAADSRVFYATAEFLRRHLLPLEHIIDDAADIYFEHALSRAVHDVLARGGRWGMLPASPDIRGIAATADSPYPASIVARARRSIFRAVKSFVLAR